jgi:hypothetical protein
MVRRYSINQSLNPPLDERPGVENLDTTVNSYFEKCSIEFLCITREIVR